MPEMDAINRSTRASFGRLVPFVIIAIAVALLTPSLMKFVVKMGHQIAQSEMALDYLAAVVWAALLGALLMACPLPVRDRPALLGLWSAKVVVALGFMLIYENYYGLDAFDYFKRARTSIQWAAFLPGNGTETVTNITRLHYQLGIDSYHMMKLDFALAGLAGVYIFYRTAVLFLGRDDLRLLIILGLTPSILFWSSILGKDPLVMLAVAIYSYGAVALWQRFRLSYLLLIAFGMTFAAVIRIWMAPILALPLAVLLLSIYGSWGVRLLAVAGGALLMFLLMQPLMNAYKAASARELIEAVAQRGSGFDRGGSAEDVRVVISGWGDLVKYAPQGAFSALFRPLPGEVSNPFGLMAGIEDAVLILLAIRAAIRMRGRVFGQPVILAAMALLIVWSLVYGLISAHNMGTAVRYRLQIMPVFILVMLYLGRPRTTSELA